MIHIKKIAKNNNIDTHHIFLWALSGYFDLYLELKNQELFTVVTNNIGDRETSGCALCSLTFKLTVDQIFTYDHEVVSIEFIDDNNVIREPLNSPKLQKITNILNKQDPAYPWLNNKRWGETPAHLLKKTSGFTVMFNQKPGLSINEAVEPIGSIDSILVDGATAKLINWLANRPPAYNEKIHSINTLAQGNAVPDQISTDDIAALANLENDESQLLIDHLNQLVEDGELPSRGLKTTTQETGFDNTDDKPIMTSNKYHYISRNDYAQFDPCDGYNIRQLWGKTDEHTTNPLLPSHEYIKQIYCHVLHQRSYALSAWLKVNPDVITVLCPIKRQDVWDMLQRDYPALFSGGVETMGTFFSEQKIMSFKKGRKVMNTP